MAPISQMTTLAHLMIGMGLLFAILGVAGFVLRSFSYPLALLLAVLFGVAGVLSWFARTARQKWTLFGIATLIALSATYVWVVGGGAGLGGPPALRGSPNDHDINGIAGLLASDVSFTDNVGGQMATLSGHEALRRYLTERFALDDRFSNVAADIPENPAPARANPTVSFVRSVGATMYRGNAKLVCVYDLLRDIVMSAG